MHSLDFNTLILIRTSAAVLFGFGIGLERELTNKYAGLRTHILVCLGACIFTILSIYAFPAAVLGSHGDPARVAAQIITGIGFIGGGTVLRHGSSVFGLTTAATLWIAASIGMACGSGMLDMALIATLLSVGVLVLVRLFEKNVLVHSTKNLKRVKILISCKEKDAEAIHGYILENFETMHELAKRQKEEEDNDLVEITASVDCNGKKPVESLYKKFASLKGVESILIREDNE